MGINKIISGFFYALTIVIIAVVMISNTKPCDDERKWEASHHARVAIHSQFVGKEKIKEQRNEIAIKPMEEILSFSKRQDLSPNRAVLNELSDSVLRENDSYESIFGDYQEAIKRFERLSENFDSALRDGTDITVLRELDSELQVEAQEILSLQKRTTLAYSILMAKYDAVMPHILSRYF